MDAVVKQLNKIQAEAHAFYVAFHDYHWNVKGMQFYSIHEYTEHAYDDMGDLFDDMAERALMIGGRPLISIDEIVKAGKGAPVEAKGDYTADAVLVNMQKAYEYLKAEFIKLEEVAEKAGDQTTVAMAQEGYAKLEKSLWMLRQALSK